tara:strand:+ start:5303 stop:6316 length:1014 start_codon:yes stop_codon:yes gene_type:complete
MNPILKTYSDVRKNKENKKNKENRIIGKSLRGNKNKIYICCDYEDNIQILIKNTKNNKQKNHPNIELNNIEVIAMRELTFTSNNKKVEGNFFSIKLIHNQSEVIKLSLFCDVMLVLIQSLKFPIKTLQLYKKIKELINIFSKDKKISEETIQGLWAELFLIYSSRNIALALENWHENPNDKYDFGKENNFVEVKSTLSNQRKHRLSLHQAYAKPFDTVIIASYILEREGEKKLSLKDLYDEIYLKLLGNEILINKLIKNVYSIVSASEDIFKQSYDSIEARKNLKFFDLKDIPKLPDSDMNISGVTDISFTSNLGFSKEIDKRKFKKKSQFFKNIIL